MNVNIQIQLLSYEQIKLMITLLDNVEKYLKKTIIIILQKLIKNLCKTIKTIALTDKYSSCDD
jgi:hypothetical protein